MAQNQTPDIRLEPVLTEELPAYEALYLEAFPASERKPFSLLQTRAQEGKAELLSIRFDGAFAGLAVTLLHGPYVLVDYLAVAPDFRNHGIGAVALNLLRARYPRCRRILFRKLRNRKPNCRRAGGTFTSETAFCRPGWPSPSLASRC